MLWSQNKSDVAKSFSNRDEFRHRAFSDRPATVTRRIDIDHGIDYNLPVVADVGCIFVDLYPKESQGDRHEINDADAANFDRNCRSTR